MKKNKKEAKVEKVIEKEKVGLVPFVIAWLSFIPIVGVFFALIAIMLGLSSEKEGAKKLTLLGLIGFLYSIVIYGVVIYLELKSQGLGA